MNYTIYSLTDSDGGLYIGCTTNTTKRKADHYSKLRLGEHGNKSLQAQYDKSQVLPTFSVQGNYTGTKLEAIAKEQQIIRKLSRRLKLHNVQYTADTLSALARDKNRRTEAKARRPSRQPLPDTSPAYRMNTPEVKAKLNAVRKTPEWREKQRLAQIGKQPPSPRARPVRDSEGCTYPSLQQAARQRRPDLIDGRKSIARAIARNGVCWGLTWEYI